MRLHTFRPQRTIARPVDVRGHGFLTGAVVRLRFRPAPADAGIAFLRTDLKGTPLIPATVQNVTGTNRRTTLGRAPAQVELVEHVMSALAGLRIDNCIVELNALEPPGLDGSSLGFVEALQTAGIVTQSAQRPVWTTETPIGVSERLSALSFHPGSLERLKISYLLDYGSGSPIGLQRFTSDATPECYCNSIAMCRTFLLKAEAEELRRQGLGSQTTPQDLLIFGPHGPIENQLRFADEPARHKVLDIMGDLWLLGFDLVGHVVAFRSGHSLNVQLGRRLLAEQEQLQPRRQRVAA